MGKNLHVLGQIEGVDLDLYRDIVLPRILEQVSVVYLQFLFLAVGFMRLPLEYNLMSLYDKHVL